MSWIKKDFLLVVEKYKINYNTYIDKVVEAQAQSNYDLYTTTTTTHINLT